jgi:hypothetical protein
LIEDLSKLMPTGGLIEDLSKLMPTGGLIVSPPCNHLIRS